MSKCKCPERAKPALDREWDIVSLEYSGKSFGRNWELKAKAKISCMQCGAIWTSRKDWVELLREEGLL